MKKLLLGLALLSSIPTFANCSLSILTSGFSHAYSGRAMTSKTTIDLSSSENSQGRIYHTALGENIGSGGSDIGYPVLFEFKIIGKTLRLQKYFYEHLGLVSSSEREVDFENIHSTIHHYRDGTKIEIDCL